MAYSTAFFLGLIGSLHCAGMCGPIALSLPGTGGTLSSALKGRVCYNAGRILSYGTLGLVFGTIGKTLALAGLQRWTSILCGVVLLVLCFGGANRKLECALGKPLMWLKLKLAWLLRVRSVSALLALGLLNGLLPCGLVYAACTAAISQGGCVEGGAYMLVFGMGTLPMMLGISLAGKSLQFKLRLRFQGLIPVSLAVLGTLLILRGLSLGIPYVSPDLGHAGALRCH
jgi:sulfite exporter TauE/SafE